MIVKAASRHLKIIFQRSQCTGNKSLCSVVLVYRLGMLKPVFVWQTGFRLLKTSFKPVFGFTNLHKNILLYKANNFMYNALLSIVSLALLLFIFRSFLSYLHPVRSVLVIAELARGADLPIMFSLTRVTKTLCPAICTI